MSAIGISVAGYSRPSPPSIVEISPSDIARRRLANWGAIQADTVKVTRRETFEYGFQARRHLLVAYERAERMMARRLSRVCQNRLCANSIASSASCLPAIVLRMADAASADARHIFLHRCEGSVV